MDFSKVLEWAGDLEPVFASGKVIRQLENLELTASFLCQYVQVGLSLGRLFFVNIDF